LALLLVFLAAAIGSRLYTISSLPGFAPVRQYIGLTRARAYYYWLAQPPGPLRDVVLAQAPPPIEPPLIDLFTACVYLALGRVEPMVPCLAASLAWVLLGGSSLYLLASRRLGFEGGLASLVVFAAAPFGVIASRSMQPDPWAVAFLCLALWRMHVAVKQPTRARVVGAALAASAAVSFKSPMVFFLLPAAFGALLSSRRRPRPWTCLGLGAIVVGPAALWQFGTPWAASGVTELLVTPQAVARIPGFLGRVAGQLETVVGGAWVFAATLGGALLLRRYDRTLSAMCLGGLAGYLLFVVVFAYRTATHHYYHLPLLTFAALGAAGWVTLGRELARRARAGAYSTRLACLALLTIAFGLGTAEGLRRLRDGRPIRDSAGLYQALGEATGHSTAVISYDTAYGYPLRYHGFMAGAEWKYANRALLHEVVLGRGDQKGLAALREMLRRRRYTHFVLREPQFRAQEPDVHALLRKRCRRVLSVYEFSVFELDSLYEGWVDSPRKD
jgi:4-amino-4-deoxy-L-arabinose transferase-like glycosyltransferase